MTDTCTATNILGLVLLLICFGLLVHGSVRLRGIKRDQRAIEARQKEIAADVAAMPVPGKWVGTASWRELPPEARETLREGLTLVLAEMEAERAVRH
jgi:hypothetical protein